jgi:hypothetical protein
MSLRRFPLFSLLSTIGSRHLSGRVSRGLLILDGQGVSVSPKDWIVSRVPSRLHPLCAIKGPTSSRTPLSTPARDDIHLSGPRPPLPSRGHRLCAWHWTIPLRVRLTSADKEFGDHHGSGRPVLDREARVDIFEMSFHGLGSHAQNHPNFLVCLSLR